MRRRCALHALAAAFAAAFFVSALPAAHAQPTSWEYPTGTSYAAGASDSGKGLASDNLAGGAASITVALPATASIANGWSMTFREGGDHGIILNAPVGSYILAGQKTLTSLTIPSDDNYETAEVSFDGTNFQLTSVTQATALANGLTGAAGASNWTYLFSAGYSATPADNGHVLSSADTGAATTVTLPSTPLLPTGWSVSLAQDGGHAITAQVNGVSGGEIVTPDGRQVASYAPGTGQATVRLQFDGANFRVSADTSLYRAPNLLNFGAKADGSKDVAAALDAAVALAQTTDPAMPVVRIPAGQYLLDGSGGAVDLTHVTLRCEGSPADADASASGTGGGAIGHQGATFWLTSTSVQPFAFGPGVTFEGCNFYWPNQKPNGGSAITVGASPFTYTNSTGESEEVSVTGGTVSNITVNGVSQPYSSGTFDVPNGQAIVVTYSAAPAMAFWEPIVYPALFTEITGQQATNIRLLHDHIINAYDVWDQASASDSQGSIHIDGTYGYAIHDWFRWALNMNTTVVRGLLADFSLAQDIDPSPYFMREWTAHNGAIWDVFGTTGTDGSQESGGLGAIEMSGSGIYQYRWFIHVNPGGLITESNFTGNTVDGVGTDVQVDAGGCLSGTRLIGDWYAYIPDTPHGLWNASAIDSNPAFALYSEGSQGCATTDVEIGGLLEQAQGDVLDIVGPLVKTVTLSLPGADTYGRTTAAGTYFFVQTDPTATGLILDVHDSHIEPPAGDAGINRQGFYLNALYQGSFDGNTFNGVYNPITLGSGVSAGRVAGAGNVAIASPTGSISVGSGTGPSYDYTDAHNLLAAPSNRWDAVPAPSCGAGCASLQVGSTDARGIVQVASGSATSVAITFAMPYAANPTCEATSTVDPLFISSISSTGITWAASGSANLAGSQIYYGCRP